MLHRRLYALFPRFVRLTSQKHKIDIELPKAGVPVFKPYQHPAEHYRTPYHWLLELPLNRTPEQGQAHFATCTTYYGVKHFQPPILCDVFTAQIGHASATRAWPAVKASRMHAITVTIIAAHPQSTPAEPCAMLGPGILVMPALRAAQLGINFSSQHAPLLAKVLLAPFGWLLGIFNLPGCLCPVLQQIHLYAASYPGKAALLRLAGEDGPQKPNDTSSVLRLDLQASGSLQSICLWEGRNGHASVGGRCMRSQCLCTYSSKFQWQC